MLFRPTAPSQGLANPAISQPTFSYLNSSEQYLTPDGKQLYFTARSDSYGGAAPTVEERWVTDGTAAGTRKVGKALYSGTNNLYGRSARDFVNLGRDRFIYTAGEGIWVSDISGNNPIELRKFDTIPVYKQPDLPSVTIVNQTSNGTVFFTGDELGPNSFSLWKSDGTAIGTVKVKELMPRTYGPYLSYNGYTTETVAIGNTLYFTKGDGAVQNNEFWQTNALTNETKPVDFFQGKIDRLSKVNQKLLFSGKANDGRQGWWVSDGSLVGTKFLGDFDIRQSNASTETKQSYVAGVPGQTSNLLQGDVFYFTGKAKDGRQGLWSVNLATATTQLLDSLPAGFLDSKDYGGYRHFKVELAGDRTYVWSVDETTNLGVIWETNGTTAGTRKLTFNDPDRQAITKRSGDFLKIQDRIYLINSEYKEGGYNDKISLWDLNPASTQPWASLTGYQLNRYERLNGDVYLDVATDPAQGLDRLFKLDSNTGALAEVTQTGYIGSWQKLGDRLVHLPAQFYGEADWSDSLVSTDGTATTTLLNPRQLFPKTPVANPKLILGKDLDTLGLSDRWHIKGAIQSSLVAHDQETGEVALFDPRLKKLITLYTVADTNWQIKGIADLNSDGVEDLFWQHQISGQTAIWNVKNQALASGTFLIPVTDPNWKVEGFADMDRDGKTDILWQHKTQGTFAFWKMDGNTINSGVYLPSAPDLNWSVKGLADFDKDGDMDILWQNDNTGEIKLWRLEDNKVAYTVNLLTVSDRNWQIRGVADFDLDGQYDLLWTNTATREVAFWSWGDELQKGNYEAYVSQEDLDRGDPSKWTYNFYKSVTPKGTYLNRLNLDEIDAIAVV
jgi:ELWxxDGT repeat protein